MTTTAELMNRLAPSVGLNATRLDGVRIYKATQSSPRSPLLYTQGIIIVGQGKKRVFLGDTAYEYTPDRYLVMSVPIPAECEAPATEEEPFLAMLIDINLAHVSTVIGKMGDHLPPLAGTGDTNRGLFLAEADAFFKETTARLLSALTSPIETEVLGDALLQELFFRVMCGDNAASLYALAVKNTHLSRIDKVLKQIHSHYQRPMDVDQLAGLVNMSPSAFHRAFKEVTASSPIQYIKKVRLNKARDLLVLSGARVNEAATQVGYESPTQFSREFKRYFGESPVAFSNQAARATASQAGAASRL
ncbi:AraC family transcriptional regulator [Desulfoluna spongiiphila]|uniref:AraC family transcriptional regulator n=1 Tax=Desulfoluna spongiiphila TaxID=419481 RepID=UPI001251A296|nr:AraC family transcriptional regulator [Desulfoluna spongiiphila]VVS92546.1 transcription regulator hth arac- type [Desulfoluna spongiiphila]